MKRKLLAFAATVLAVTLMLSMAAVTAFAADSGYTVKPDEKISVTDDAKLWENGDSSKGGDNRYADNAKYFVYKANFGSVSEGALAYLTVYNSRNRSVQVSSDNQNYTEVFGAKYSGSGEDFEKIVTQHVFERGADGSDPNKLFIRINLDEFLSDDGSVYIKICANDTQYGWGGDLRAIEFKVASSAVLDVAADGSTTVNLADSELVYDIVGTSVGNGAGSTKHRFADNSNYFVYRIKWEQLSGDKHAEIFWKGSNRAMYASKDGDSFTLIGSAGSDDKAALKKGDGGIADRGYYCYYDLAEYVNAEGYTFIKFAAQDTARGNGADVFYLRLIDGETDNYGQSQSAGIDMSGSEMITEVPVTDFTAAGLDGSGASLLPYDGRLMLAAKSTQEVVYQIDLPANADPSRSYLRMETRGTHNVLEASADGDGYTKVGNPGTDTHGAVVKDGNVHYYSLTPFVSGEKLYLRFSSDEKTDTGAEAFIASLTLFINRNFEQRLSLPENYSFDLIKLYAGDKEQAYFQPQLSYRENVNNMDDAGYRYYDANSYGVYKLDYDQSAVSLSLVMDVRGGYRISVSDDAKNWKDVIIGEVTCVRAQARLNLDFKQANITDLVAKTGSLYVKVADASTDGGWGGAFTSITLMAVVQKGEPTPAQGIFPEGKLNTSVALYDPKLLNSGADETQNAYLGRKITAGGSFSYKFELPSDARSFYIAMNAENLTVTVGTNGTDFAEVDNKYILDETNGYGSMLTYNLTHLLDGGKTVYVRFAKTTANDEGILYTLYAGYNVTEQAGDEYSQRSVQAFLANDSTEAEYLFEYDYTQMGVTNKYKEFNRTSYATYRFEGDSEAKAVKLIASVGNSFVLSVSSDNKIWRDVVISDQQYYGNNHLSDDTVRDIYIDITQFARGEYVYVRVTDLIDDNDCGAQLRGLGIVAMSGDKVTAGEPSGDGKGSSCGSFAAAGTVLPLGVIMLASAVILIKRKGKNNETK